MAAPELDGSTKGLRGTPLLLLQISWNGDREAADTCSGARLQTQGDPSAHIPCMSTYLGNNLATISPHGVNTACTYAPPAPLPRAVVLGAPDPLTTILSPLP